MRIALPFDDENVDEAIAFMRGEMEVDTDKGLAEALGIDPSAVAAWRRRKSVPKKYLLRFRRVADERADWREISPSFYRLRNAYVFALLSLFASRINDIRIYKDDDFQEIWRGFRLHRIHVFLEAAFSALPAGDRDKLRQKYQELRNDVDREDMFAWMESLPEPFA